MIKEAIQIADRISQKSIDNLSEEQLKKIISLIDYTTLNDTDTDESVSKWMKESIQLMNSVSTYCGGWCVYPEFVPLILSQRNSLPISIAAVSGNFPSGKAMTQLKIEEAVLTETMGAEEIDIVINKGWASEEAFTKIEKEIRLIKGSLEKAHLKVIMETGLLDHSKIEKISVAAIRAGADFIKTSTGKTKNGASLHAVAIMCFAIKEHFLETGRKVGIKPSGGISDAFEAQKYVSLVQEILGDEWLDNKLFRIGASRLLSNTIQELKA